MSDVNIQGDPDDIIWGSDGVDTGWTIVNDAEKATTGAEREIKDNWGNTCVLVLFDEKNECTVNAVGEASATVPDRGDTRTIAGVLCIVLEVTEKWKNDQEQMVTIKARRYVTNALPAAGP